MHPVVVVARDEAPATGRDHRHCLRAVAVYVIDIERDKRDWVPVPIREVEAAATAVRPGHMRVKIEGLTNPGQDGRDLLRRGHRNERDIRGCRAARDTGDG